MIDKEIVQSTLILEPAYKTEVYVSETNRIVIRQDDWSGDDLLVVLNKMQAKAVADHIKKLLREYEIEG